MHSLFYIVEHLLLIITNRETTYWVFKNKTPKSDSLPWLFDVQINGCLWRKKAYTHSQL